MQTELLSSWISNPAPGNLLLTLAATVLVRNNIEDLVFWSYN